MVKIQLATHRQLLKYRCKQISKTAILLKDRMEGE